MSQEMLFTLFGSKKYILYSFVEDQKAYLSQKAEKCGSYVALFHKIMDLAIQGFIDRIVLINVS